MQGFQWVVEPPSSSSPVAGIDSSRWTAGWLLQSIPDWLPCRPVSDSSWTALSVGVTLEDRANMADTLNTQVNYVLGLIEQSYKNVPQRSPPASGYAAHFRPRLA